MASKDPNTKLGLNRTGLKSSPLESGAMQSPPDAAPEPPPGDESAMAAERGEQTMAAGALGSVPPPATVRGMLSTGMHAIAGHRPQVFVDKLAERLAFERSGTRLYEALIAKCRARPDELHGMDVSRLIDIHDEEARHFRLLSDCLDRIGADPTAQTPCADLVGVESQGLMQAVTDPRTSVAQAMHAVLVAELADHASWELLTELATGLGHDQMAADFREAGRREAQHVMIVRDWLARATQQEAGLH